MLSVLAAMCDQLHVTLKYLIRTLDEASLYESMVTVKHVSVFKEKSECIQTPLASIPSVGSICHMWTGAGRYPAERADTVRDHDHPVM